MPTVNRERVKAMSLKDLVHGLVYDPSNAALYRYEYREREEGGLGYEGFLKSFDSKTTRHGEHDNFVDDEPASPVPLGDVARSIISSGFPFTGLRDKEPAQVKRFVQTIVETNVSETILSPKQVRYWRSIKGAYRKWLGMNTIRED
jgi:hypothetical protein